MLAAAAIFLLATCCMDNAVQALVFPGFDEGAVTGVAGGCYFSSHRDVVPFTHAAGVGHGINPADCLAKCLEQGTSENGLAVGLTKQADNKTICVCSFNAADRDTAVTRKFPLTQQSILDPKSPRQ